MSHAFLFFIPNPVELGCLSYGRVVLGMNKQANNIGAWVESDEGLYRQGSRESGTE